MTMEPSAPLTSVSTEAMSKRVAKLLESLSFDFDGAATSNAEYAPYVSQKNLDSSTGSYEIPGPERIALYDVQMELVTISGIEVRQSSCQDIRGHKRNSSSPEKVRMVVAIVEGSAVRAVSTTSMPLRKPGLQDVTIEMASAGQNEGIVVHRSRSTMPNGSQFMMADWTNCGASRYLSTTRHCEVSADGQATLSLQIIVALVGVNEEEEIQTEAYPFAIAKVDAVFDINDTTGVSIIKIPLQPLQQHINEYPSIILENAKHAPGKDDTAKLYRRVWGGRGMFSSRRQRANNCSLNVENESMSDYIVDSDGKAILRLALKLTEIEDDSLIANQISDIQQSECKMSISQREKEEPRNPTKEQHQKESITAVDQRSHEPSGPKVRTSRMFGLVLAKPRAELRVSNKSAVELVPDTGKSRPLKHASRKWRVSRLFSAGNKAPNKKKSPSLDTESLKASEENDHQSMSDEGGQIETERKSNPEKESLVDDLRRLSQQLQKARHLGGCMAFKTSSDLEQGANKTQVFQYSENDGSKPREGTSFNTNQGTTRSTGVAVPTDEGQKATLMKPVVQQKGLLCDTLRSPSPDDEQKITSPMEGIRRNTPLDILTPMQIPRLQSKSVGNSCSSSILSSLNLIPPTERTKVKSKSENAEAEQTVNGSEALKTIEAKHPGSSASEVGSDQPALHAKQTTQSNLIPPSSPPSGISPVFMTRRTRSSESRVRRRSAPSTAKRSTNSVSTWSTAQLAATLAREKAVEVPAQSSRQTYRKQDLTCSIGEEEEKSVILESLQEAEKSLIDQELASYRRWKLDDNMEDDMTDESGLSWHGNMSTLSKPDVFCSIFPRCGGDEALPTTQEDHSLVSWGPRDSVRGNDARDSKGYLLYTPNPMDTAMNGLYASPCNTANLAELGNAILYEKGECWNEMIGTPNEDIELAKSIAAFKRVMQDSESEESHEDSISDEEDTLCEDHYHGTHATKFAQRDMTFSGNRAPTTAATPRRQRKKIIVPNQLRCDDTEDDDSPNGVTDFIESQQPVSSCHFLADAFESFIRCQPISVAREVPTTKTNERTGIPMEFFTSDDNSVDDLTLTSHELRVEMEQFKTRFAAGSSTRGPSDPESNRDRVTGDYLAKKKPSDPAIDPALATTRKLLTVRSRSMN